jgi:hypothetical protein
VGVVLKVGFKASEKAKRHTSPCVTPLAEAGPLASPRFIHNTMQHQQQPQLQQARPRLVSTRTPSFTLPRSTSVTHPIALTPSQIASTKPAATQRSSKTHQKLVELPSDPQTRPLPTEPGEDDGVHGYETDTGVRMREHKSPAERMTKTERRRAGCRRITAYWLADGFRMKLLANFLKREHNVVPRSFDEALYVVRATPQPPLLPHFVHGFMGQKHRCTTSHYSLVTAPRPKCAPQCPRHHTPVA